MPWNAVITNLNLRLARADGAAVWLNGQELFRVNLLDGPISYTNLALTTMTGYTSHIFYPTNFITPGLPTGTNIVAVEVHESSPKNATLGFDMELIGSGYLLARPSLAIAQAGNSFVLSWPATNGGSFALYSATNLDAAAPWSHVTAPFQTNSGQISVPQSFDATARFFRLQRP